LNVAKIAISIEPSLLKQIDSLVSRKLFRSRSEIFQIAVTKQIELLDEDAFKRECAKLDPVEEQVFADIGISTDLTEWPAYLEVISTKPTSTRPSGTNNWEGGQSSSSVVQLSTKSLGRNEQTKQ
jgi:Arc/MetJ-type ribon-helix-helix transcriptional regulator